MISLPDFEKKQWLTVFCRDGEKVTFKNDNVVVKDSKDQIIHQSTCYRMFCLMIVGPFLLTSGILERSKKFGFSIILLSYNFRVYEALMAENRGNTLLRSKQYAAPDFSIARHLVSNKVMNQILLLKQERNKTADDKAVIQSLKSYLEKIKYLENDFDSLLGYEGQSARLYFQHYFKSINWKRRSPRTKIDIPNVLLDIGYTHLFNIMESLMVLFGFDVYQGVYHRAFYQRKSLVCDLMEPFRCIIDHTLKRAYGLNRINPEDFNFKTGQFSLSYQHSKKYSLIFVEGISKHRLALFKFVRDYYRAFMKNKSGSEFPLFDMEK